MCALWLALNVIKLTFKNASGSRLGIIPWPAVYFTISLIGVSVYDSWYQALSVFVITFICCIDPQKTQLKV
jgi:hypothetical protein